MWTSCTIVSHWGRRSPMEPGGASAVPLTSCLRRGGVLRVNHVASLLGFGGRDSAPRSSPRRVLRSLAVFSLLLVPVLVGSACTTCNKKSCVEPGVYLTLGLEPRAAAAAICVDGTCTTLPVQRGDGLTGADQQFALRVNDPLSWTAGRKVTLSIDILDDKGVSLAKITEERTMASLGGSACSPCPAFLYNLSDGKLVRVASA